MAKNLSPKEYNLIKGLIILAISNGPIEVFSEKSCSGLLKESYLKLFQEAPWDKYLHRQSQLDWIADQEPSAGSSMLTAQDRNEFYLGILSAEELVKKLSCNLDLEGVKHSLEMIKPSRKRFISSAIATIIDGNITGLQRIKTKPFGQALAEIEHSEKIDFRSLPRVFTELPQQYFNDDLVRFIESNIKRAAKSNPRIKMLNITVHHTCIVCDKENYGTNSPEGIHQDGSDYLVSAYVLERNNIQGGASVIFGEDKSTEILRTTLDAGYGIFQPDLHTNIWHYVEPIEVAQGASFGWRSSVGLDLDIMELHP
ncbi:2OG-Fe dioxygenase family protein [Vibrio pectenicida]|uniref:2OG-Fe dioxygenase family protein n=1 Tax=Vibrio pectenicida TaxID=62763 RepID=A0A7Y3ZZE0_9VIBR|nr:2OG-Fe dioxygenase family protein [Vibrio pectenicida]NOH71905.1 2OG-Fe dioxygenase family protein [Vibrio pectenicida]